MAHSGSSVIHKVVQREQIILQLSRTIFKESSQGKYYKQIQAGEGE